MKTVCKRVNTMISFKWLTLLVTFVLMFPLLLVYENSYYFFAPFEERIKYYKAPNIRARVFSNLENDKNNDFYDTRWVNKLNYTVDYGDKTCEETKNGNPRKKIFVQLLQQWKQISKKYRIPYFIVYGSLIGAIRNADFIPWDHDMDIFIDESYYEIISKVDNNRNFTPNANDPNFHLIVQNYFRSEYSNFHKTRQNCLGQVTLKLNYHNLYAFN